MSDDVFNLNDIFPVRKDIEDNQDHETLEEEVLGISQDDEITTSYLLVNALLNLLISKGIIHPHEINSLLAELHAQYRQNKK